MILNQHHAQDMLILLVSRHTCWRYFTLNLQMRWRALQEGKVYLKQIHISNKKTTTSKDTKEAYYLPITLFGRLLIILYHLLRTRPKSCKESRTLAWRHLEIGRASCREREKI